MEIEIQKQRETPLLARKRVTAIAHYEGTTPSRIQIRKEIASKVKSDEDLVIIRHIYTKFGSRDAKIIAHVYNDKAMVEKLEGKKLIDKHSGKKAEKKEEKAAE